ncbi:MAG: hypothetical protein ISR25_03975 [Candidatus Poseidoniaceae archaeon]|nr:hypothetical protein [Candidatus Poseidoniaceae archaeon]MBL6889629.1 hypothetical protein [Candidatus Poseidoniaceae archaeon]
MTKKAFFVISVLLSVSLAGCLDDSSSESSTNSSTDSILFDVVNDCENLELNTQTTNLSNGSNLVTILGVNVSLYHAAYSTSSVVSVGFDVDLDGSLDAFNNVSKGTTSFYLPMSSFSNLSNDRFVTTIAATASTANGVSSMLVHIANDCQVLSEINLGQLTSVEPGFDGYDFEVNSAGTTFTSATGEAIVYVSLDAGDDLSWSTVIVQMKADGGVYVECTNPDKASATGCAVDDNDDGKWAFGEEVTISEGSDDTCSSGTCEVQVKILDRSTNKLIYESNTINA